MIHTAFIQAIDTRVIVDLQIPMGEHQLTDRFEWDLTDMGKNNNPELFARQMCKDLGFGGE